MSTQETLRDVAAALTEINGADRFLTNNAELRTAYQALTGRLAGSNSHLPVGVVTPATLPMLTTTLGLVQKKGVKTYTTPRTPQYLLRPESEPYLILDLALLTHIGPIDPTSQTLEVQVGAPIAAVEQYVHDLGYSLGFNATTDQNLTIGSCLASGIWGHNVGEDSHLSANLVALAAVLPDGTFFHTVPSPRSAAGPNLAKFFTASGNLLCVPVTVTLGIIPKGERKLFRIGKSSTVDKALEGCRLCLQSRLRPRELLVVRNQQASDGWLVVAKFEGLTTLVETQTTLYYQIMGAHEVIDITEQYSLAEAEALTKVNEPVESSFHCAVKIDWLNLPPVWRLIQNETAAYTPTYLFSGMGYNQVVLHIWLVTRDRAQGRIAKKLITELEHLALPTQIRCPWVRGVHNQVERDLILAIKHSADPNDVLNPAGLNLTDWI